MAEFTISGIVEQVGSSGTLVGVELDYDFLLSEFSFSTDDQGHREGGLLYTDQNGAFSVTFEVPDSVISALQGNAVLLLTVRPHLPAPGIEIQHLLQGSASANLQEAQDLATGLEILFDRTTAISATLNFDLRDEFEALEGHDDLRLHLVSGTGGMVLATGLARRLDESRFRANIFVGHGAGAPDDCWILLHDGPGYRPEGFLGATEVGRVLARTFAISLDSLPEAEDDRLLLMQVDSTTGVGTVSAGMPEQITTGALISRDLDVDFIDERLRVRGRLGIGISGFQVFEVGRFVTFFELSTPDRGLTPFSNAELYEPIDVELVDKTFDLLPGTDLDEVGGALGVENFLAEQVADVVRDTILVEIAKAVADEIDEVFTEIEESLAWSDDPQGTTDEIRATVFLHVDDVRLTDDDIEVRAFAGIWHWITGLASLECPASTASVMFASRRPLPMYRRYQKALSKKSLEPWLERYEEVAPELARFARRNPLFTARAVRLAFDLLPALNPDGKVPFPADAADEATALARQVARDASPELTSLVEHASRVLERGAGRTVPELTRLAAHEGRRLPRR